MKMESAAGLVKINPGCEPLVDDWRSTIEQRCEEAIETLRGEGVVIESWFRIEIEGHPYLLWYMRAESIKRAWEIARQSSHEIDAFHFETMSKIAESQIEAVPLHDLYSDKSNLA